MRATSAAGDQTRPRVPLTTDLEEEEVSGCCDWTAREPRMETIIDLEKADSTIEIAKVKVADADVKIVRSSNYIKVVEDALKKSPNNPDLEEELHRAREELAISAREKEESEAEQKLAEAQQHHAFFVKEQFEDREERVVFRKGTFWQHCATYLLYFVGLMNFFITTFGISGGRYGPIIQVNNTMTWDLGTTAYRRRFPPKLWVHGLTWLIGWAHVTDWMTLPDWWMTGERLSCLSKHMLIQGWF